MSINSYLQSSPIPPTTKVVGLLGQTVAELMPIAEEKAIMSQVSADKAKA